MHDHDPSPDQLDLWTADPRLVECPECRQLARDLGLIRHGLHQLPRPTTSRSFTLSQEQAARLRSPRARLGLALERWRPRQMAPAPLAVALALVLLATVIIPQAGQFGSRPGGIETSQEQDLTTAMAEESSLPTGVSAERSLSVQAEKLTPATPPESAPAEWLGYTTECDSSIMLDEDTCEEWLNSHAELMFGPFPVSSTADGPDRELRLRLAHEHGGDCRVELWLDQKQISSVSPVACPDRR